MHGKGLALPSLLLALCLPIAGCGGGGANTTGAGEGSSSTQSAPAAVEELRSRAKRIEEERQGQAQASAGEEREGNAGAGKAPAAPSTPDPTPANPHHDRGGGAAQFANKGGDNSIQESGHEASASEREEAAAVLHAYFDARVHHEWSTACFYMAAGLVVSLERFAARYSEREGVKSCPQVLAAFAEGSTQKDLLETDEVDVGSLRIEGDRALILYYGPKGAPYTMSMLREAGAWKVGSLEGTPLG